MREKTNEARSSGLYLKAPLALLSYGPPEHVYVAMVRMSLANRIGTSHEAVPFEAVGLRSSREWLSCGMELSRSVRSLRHDFPQYLSRQVHSLAGLFFEEMKVSALAQ
jgi:hypothetical protein